jgi:uncharacterized protein (TIGR02246 family)
MKSLPGWIRCFVGVCGLAVAAAGLRATDDANEAAIRRDLASLEAALQAGDPTAWVYWYTADAMFVGPGEAPVQGRAALLEMAKAMTPLRALKLIPVRIESSGSLAYAFARGQWLGGKPGAEQIVRVRTLLALRREADGHWRVAQELMHDDPEPVKKE